AGTRSASRACRGDRRPRATRAIPRRRRGERGAASVQPQQVTHLLPERLLAALDVLAHAVQPAGQRRCLHLRAVAVAEQAAQRVIEPLALAAAVLVDLEPDVARVAQ